MGGGGNLRHRLATPLTIPVTRQTTAVYHLQRRLALPTGSSQLTFMLSAHVEQK